MLIELAVKNFKSIEDLRLKLKPLTIFTGPNSSGKSNILESIAILAQTTRLKDNITRSIAGSLQSGEFFTYPFPPYEFIAHRGDLNRWISFEIHTLLNDDERSAIQQLFKAYPVSRLRAYVKQVTSVSYTYSFKPEGEEATQYASLNDFKLIEIAKTRLSPSSSKNSVISPVSLGSAGFSVSPEYMLNPEPLVLGIPDIATNHIKKMARILSIASNKVIGILINRLHNSYFISATRGVMKPTVETVGEPSWVGKQGEHLTEILALCFGKREYQSKADKIIEWAEKFGIGKIKAGWWGRNVLGSDFEDPTLRTPLNLVLSSYGSRQLLTVIVQIFWSNPGDVIMIEEPEISLHPEHQVLLQELFKEAVKGGKQIIYTTHSPFLILALSRIVGKGEDKLSKDDIAVYHVEKFENGTKAKPLELNERGFIAGWIESYAKVEDKLFHEWAESIEEE